MSVARIRTAVIVASCLAVLLLSPRLAGAGPAPETVSPAPGAAAEAARASGYTSRMSLADSVVKLVQAGVIHPGKFAAAHARGGAASQEVDELLRHHSFAPILITRENAALYVNALWPLGLANRMAINDASPLNGSARFGYASTGGWTLGMEANGGAYFNEFPIVTLSARQEALVAKVAHHSFRPCCNNSTFFQDCNHGSALLGLLVLGASQGLGEDELYREALAFNSFWFPHEYANVGIYFRELRGIGWKDVDPRLAMSAEISSASGYRSGVVEALRARGLLHPHDSPACSV